jgi:hypothetical protein
LSVWWRGKIGEGLVIAPHDIPQEKSSKNPSSSFSGGEAWGHQKSQKSQPEAPKNGPDPVGQDQQLHGLDIGPLLEKAMKRDLNQESAGPDQEQASQGTQIEG